MGAESETGATRSGRNQDGGHVRGEKDKTAGSTTDLACDLFRESIESIYNILLLFRENTPARRGFVYRRLGGSMPPAGVLDPLFIR